ncbi:uncharacterized protein LOC134252490 [Saccostrea cucullata]|uniref:uncharacterized protein LOC134252490 n=1 Tax=Saccostrea cuccullata TaxID=36930 RepID=UPI002ED59683
MEEDHESLVKSDFTGVCEENSCISHFDSDDGSFVDCIHFDPPENSLTQGESVEVDIFYTAPPLKDLYRYHIFFSHSVEDAKWISGIVHRLEADPYNYKCHYNDSVIQTKQNIQQTLMSAVILSERVVIVLSPSYVKTNWTEFQELLQNLTSCSLHQQRMLVVLLKDCNIPEQLQPLGFLDARECDFFDCLVRYLRSDRLPRSSDSFSSEMSSILYRPLSVANGQVLSSVQISFCGAWNAELQYTEDDDVPTSLCCHGIGMNYARYMEILKSLTTISGSDHYHLLFSLRPVLFLAISLFVWMIVFVFILVYLMDDSNKSILCFRLAVFSMPMFFVFVGYFLRWRRQKVRQRIARKMVLKCLPINEELYKLEMPLLLTATLTKNGEFNIHFIYYSLSDCTEIAELLLQACTDNEEKKIAHFIRLYTSCDNFLSSGTLAERFCVMVSPIYLHRFIMHELPVSPQQRHTEFRLCLCQYIEHILDDFFRCSAAGIETESLAKTFQEKFMFRVPVVNSRHTSERTCNDNTNSISV